MGYRTDEMGEDLRNTKPEFGLDVADSGLCVCLPDTAALVSTLQRSGSREVAALIYDCHKVSYK